jgi:hypothetical protein
VTVFHTESRFTSDETGIGLGKRSLQYHPHAPEFFNELGLIFSATYESSAVVPDGSLLAPGAVNRGGGGQRDIRFVGRGTDDNNYTFDGLDANGVQDQNTSVNC